MHHAANARELTGNFFTTQGKREGREKEGEREKEMRILEREENITESEIWQMKGNVPLTSEVIFLGHSLSLNPEAVSYFKII